MLATLQAARPLFASYVRIRTLAKSAALSPELQQARAELEPTLADLAADVLELAQSVRAVEQDPYRYGLDLDEVARRRALVDELRGEVDAMRAAMSADADAVADASSGDANAAATADADAAAALPPPEEFDDYAQMEQQRQVALLQEQDQQLDGVFRTVGTLRQQADDMGRELEDQTGLLDEVDSLAERVGGKLHNGMVRLRRIARKNEGESRRRHHHHHHLSHRLRLGYD